MVVPHLLSLLSKACISTSLGCYIQLPQVGNEYFFFTVLEGWNYEVKVSELQGSGGRPPPEWQVEHISVYP